MMALLLSAVAVFLVACGGEGEVVEVTRMVEVEVPTEVTREVQVEVAGESTTTVEQVQVAVEFAGGGDTLARFRTAAR